MRIRLSWVNLKFILSGGPPRHNTVMKATKTLHSVSNFSVRVNLLGQEVPYAYCSGCKTEVITVSNGKGSKPRCPKGRNQAEYGEYIKDTTCACCGHTQQVSAGEFAVHHITGSKQVENNANLVTVCVRCHNVLEAIVDKMLQADDSAACMFLDYQARGFFSPDFLATSTKCQQYRAK